MRRMEEMVRVRLRRVRLRRRVIRDRSNPFEDLAEEEFLQRFRLTKECVLNLLENIRGQLPIAADARGCPIPQHLQLLITLRCTATGGHQLTINDCYQVSQTSISKCLRTVTPIIAQMAKDYVKMPTGMNAIRVMEGFMEIARMPGIVGAIDCTHIHILRPACENPELYRNRKACENPELYRNRKDNADSDDSNADNHGVDPEAAIANNNAAQQAERVFKSIPSKLYVYI
ncbi:putative nuclease HARBI1 [Scylla paramamosain]|uniref:putative nuclease HARBI1 n=1 Tax=Scylla paramamosain TaxID=85552 RepID=UPI003083A6FE